MIWASGAGLHITLGIFAISIFSSIHRCFMINRAGQLRFQVNPTIRD